MVFGFRPMNASRAMTLATGNGQRGADWLLPQIVRDVAEVIGRRQAFILAGAVCPPASPEGLGRVRGRSGCIYIPRRLKVGRHERLTEIVGANDAAKLVRAFGGEILHFPSGEAYARHLRDRAIRRMVMDRWPVSAVAWMFDVCERTVQNLMRGV